MTPHGLAEGDQPKFDRTQQRPEMVRRIEAVLLASERRCYCEYEAADYAKVAAEIAEIIDEERKAWSAKVAREIEGAK